MTPKEKSETDMVNENNVYTMNKIKGAGKGHGVEIIGLCFLVALIILSNAVVVSTPITQEVLERVALECFLEMDQTDKRVYETTYYVDEQEVCYKCGHFTQDLCDNATKKDITLYPVYLRHYYEGQRTYKDHIIAAALVNNTWIFIEPQTDTIKTPNKLKTQGYLYYKTGLTVNNDACSGSGIRGVFLEEYF